MYVHVHISPFKWVIKNYNVAMVWLYVKLTTKMTTTKMYKRELKYNEVEGKLLQIRPKKIMQNFSTMHTKFDKHFVMHDKLL